MEGVAGARSGARPEVLIRGGTRGVSYDVAVPIWIDPRVPPDPRSAGESGLVAISPFLDPRLVRVAYRRGLFPWSSEPVVTWWCPADRAVFDLETWRPSRSLRQEVRRAGWRFTLDEDFTGVMRGCAASVEGRESTWITGDFIEVYGALHAAGEAHSVEVWEGEELVGGLYGVALGAFFGGESMFHRRTGASKAALAWLVERLRAGGFTLLDAQVMNPHLARLGAAEIPRAVFLERLKAALRASATLAPGPTPGLLGPARPGGAPAQADRAPR